jgi:Uma2 family endonuclease
MRRGRCCWHQRIWFKFVDMSIAYKLLPHYTYEDYIQWEGRWELIDGIPYAMSPMPKPEHQAVAGNLHAEFRSALRNNKCGCRVYQPLDYKVSEDTIFNPDVLVVCKPIQKTYLDFAPELVVEILSESTALKDRHVKFGVYEQQKIPYYLIVDLQQQNVEVYHLENNVYKQLEVNMGEPFTFSLSDCTAEIVFDNIWE